MNRCTIVYATLLASLLALGEVAAAVAAQAGDNLLIRAYNCERDPGAIGMGTLPEDCGLAAGVGFSVTTQDGANVGSCMTDESGGCVVPVPLGTTVLLTEDVTTLPAGYAPTTNPRSRQTPPTPAAGEFIAEFINVAVSEDDGQPASDGGMLTVYKTACPPGYPGDDFFEDCYDNPETGIEFAASNIKSSFDARGTTDTSGFVSFHLPDQLAGNLVSVGQVPTVEVPGGAEPPFVVACTRNGGQPVDFHSSLIQLDPGGDAYNVEINNIAPGDQIRCDWYNLPPAAGETPRPAADGTVTRLPDTGTGFAANGPHAIGLLVMAALLAMAGGMVVDRRAAR